LRPQRHDRMEQHGGGTNGEASAADCHASSPARTSRAIHGKASGDVN
jgi:hypothetical protein